MKGVPRWRDRFILFYGVKVSFWGYGTLKIVIYVENYPRHRSFRLNYHDQGESSSERFFLYLTFSAIAAMSSSFPREIIKLLAKRLFRTWNLRRAELSEGLIRFMLVLGEAKIGGLTRA